MLIANVGVVIGVRVGVGEKLDCPNLSQLGKLLSLVDFDVRPDNSRHFSRDSCLAPPASNLESRPSNCR